MEQRLKEYRQKKGISQSEMAKHCGVHRNTYAAWEENQDNVSIGYAKVIAKKLGVSVSDIFLESKEK